MTVLRYVALGDSYTIGTSVAETDRWPNQLVRRVVADPVRLELVANLGANGFTSRDVIEVELPRLAALRPDFVSLLIGVNDIVQGVPQTTFRGNVERILDAVLAILPANRIVTAATADYRDADGGSVRRTASTVGRDPALLADLRSAAAD